MSANSLGSTRFEIMVKALTCNELDPRTRVGSVPNSGNRHLMNPSLTGKDISEDDAGRLQFESL